MDKNKLIIGELYQLSDPREITKCNVLLKLIGDGCYIPNSIRPSYWNFVVVMNDNYGNFPWKVGEECRMSEDDEDWEFIKRIK